MLIQTEKPITPADWQADFEYVMGLEYCRLTQHWIEAEQNACNEMERLFHRDFLGETVGMVESS